jgi:hypothetical protein
VAHVRSRVAMMLWSLAVVGALVATLAFVNAIVKKSWTMTSLPSTAARPSSSPVAPSHSPYPTDDRGFIDSTARCDGTLTGIAFARTQRSLVAICADHSGNYQYRAVRLSDGAALDVPAATIDAHEFVARNDGVTYALSTKQLVITAGDTVVRREPMIDYREP